VSEGADRVELEIAGEKVVVEGWPPGLASPPGPVDVNGERWKLGEVRRDAVGLPPPPPAVPASTVRSPSGSAGGTPVTSPMPGKIIEVRVHEGDHVAQGQVVVVLEAMKMRNEVVSPIAGTVVQLGVAPGANVRAREPMLTIRPD